MKVLAWVAGLAGLVSSGVYMFVYLARWEWNRTLFMGIVLIAAEVGLGIALVLARLARACRSAMPQSTNGGIDAAVLARLAETRPRHRRFAWLADELTRANVFVTMLVGGGVVVSAVAWVLDKLGSHTTTPAAERSLARRLSVFRFPPDGLMAEDADLLARSLPGCDDPRLRLLVGPLTVSHE